MISQADILIGLVLMIVGFFFGKLRVGKAFAAIIIGIFMFNLGYSYWTLKDDVFWLSWNGQIIEATDIIMNCLMYWLFKAIVLVFRLEMDIFGISVLQF